MQVAILGAVAGHASAGMSRSDLNDMGESLDSGQAGLFVVAISDMEAKVTSAMKHAEKIEERQLKPTRRPSKTTPRPKLSSPARAGIQGCQDLGREDA